MAPPVAPSSLTATVTSPTTVDLTWRDESANEDRFSIEMATGIGTFTHIATTGANIESQTITGLSAGTSYQFRVRAENTSGVSISSNVANVITPQTAPRAPSTLMATAQQVGTLLTWTDASDNEDGFEIERAEGFGGFVALTTTGANVSTFTDTGLLTETDYHYRVRGFNGVGTSTWTNVADVTTFPSPPDAPSNLNAQLTSIGSTGRTYNLTWQDNSTNEDEFVVEVYEGYPLYQWEWFDTLPAGTTTRIGVGAPSLSSGLSIAYRVSARNHGGDSTWSNVVWLPR